MIQKGRGDEAELVLITHPTKEKDFFAAIAEAKGLSCCKSDPMTSGCSDVTTIAGAAKERRRPLVRIAHLSDLHTGSQYFVPNLLDRTLVEVNDLAPDVVVVTGDLTNMGYRQEFREATRVPGPAGVHRRAGGAGQP